MKCYYCHKEDALFNFPEDENPQSGRIIYLCLSCARKRLSTMQTASEGKKQKKKKVQIEKKRTNKKMKSSVKKVKVPSKELVLKGQGVSKRKLNPKPEREVKKREKTSGSIKLKEKKSAMSVKPQFYSKNREDLQKSIRLVFRSNAKLKCPKCGYTIKEFQNSGILKCPECYKAFEILLNPVLEHFHGYNTYHRNKPEDL